MNMKFLRKLPIPQQIKKRYPVSEQDAAVKAARDEELKNIFAGKSDKFILVIGPARRTAASRCSIIFHGLKRCRTRSRIKYL